jgi:hypothetical protein
MCECRVFVTHIARTFSPNNCPSKSVPEPCMGFVCRNCRNRCNVRGMLLVAMWMLPLSAQT